MQIRMYKPDIFSTFKIKVILFLRLIIYNLVKLHVLQVSKEMRLSCAECSFLSNFLTVISGSRKLYILEL